MSGAVSARWTRLYNERAVSSVNAPSRETYLVAFDFSPTTCMAVVAHAAASDLPISWKLPSCRGLLAGGLWYKLHVDGAGADYSSRSSSRSIKN